MGDHTFTKWLQLEVHTARCALLKLLEEEDRLRCIEGPQIERNYMEAVGNYEETVVQEEMECELLTTKQRLVQAAINRREEIDEAAIDAKIDDLRKEMTGAAVGESSIPANLNLSVEQSDELQELYGKIVKEFHPSMHPEMTQAQKELYDKARDAYRRHDLHALNLIWEMLTEDDDEGLSIAFEMVMNIGIGIGGGSAEWEMGEKSVPVRDYSTDYSLASTLYSCFMPLQEEAAIIEECQKYKLQIGEKIDQLAELKQQFPFNAQETLNDPEQLAAYKRELEQRMRQAQSDRERLTQEIKKMIGGVKKRG